tara:strand:+ start:284 stop:2746 length:2463 start_codon:yes stop_codon:yes gene_type:complete
MALFDSIRLGASGTAEDYEVERSLFFNSADSTQLENTSLGTSPTSRKIHTISFWFKRTKITDMGMVTHGYGGTGHSARGAAFRWISNERLSFENQVNNSLVWQLVPTRRFRDPAAWYHVVMAVDTTQGTESNRVKIYINGVQETVFTTASYPSQNYENLWLYDNARLGAWDGNGYYAGYNGYLAEYHAIDGQQLTPSSFAETDSTTGEYKPIEYTGSYGNNGHYLNFSDNSNTTSSTLGKDYSGNSKNFTPYNLSVSAGTGNDCLEDTPTNNFPVFNRLNTIKYNNNYDTILEQGNLLMRGGDNIAPATFLFPKSGKWYFEVQKYGNGFSQGVSIVRADSRIEDLDGNIKDEDIIQYTTGGQAYARDSDVGTFTAWENDANVVIGIAVDMDNGAVYFAKDNTWQNSGDPTSGSNKTGAIGTDLLTVNDGNHYFAGQGFNGSDSAGLYVNFGQRAFTYSAPTGYEKLCSKNMPDPAIAKSTDHFEARLYTPNSGNLSVTGFGFQPDWLWLKSRAQAYRHYLFDAVRGTGQKALSSNRTSAEGDDSGSLTSFDSTGFTTSGSSGFNDNGSGTDGAIAWAWNAGGSTVTNNTGSISTQLRANPTAGFSIATYSGNSTGGATLGHGLGVKPDCIIIKTRDASDNWMVYHKGLNAKVDPEDYFVELNGFAADVNSPNMLNDTAPTSSVVTISADGSVNSSSRTYVMYCFADVEGFSKFGLYTGNGNSNPGAFVYTGFRPAFVITRSLQGTSWYMFDNKRNPGNPINIELNTNNNQVDSGTGTDWMDFTSNGFCFRTSDSAVNYHNNYKYIYLAWAEAPFKYARAR